MSTRRKERLTIEVEPELRDALARWATEDGAGRREFSAATS